MVPERLREMEAAYLARDFPTFARLTMQDSNQFHATCLDTYPPIFYMNDVSKQIVHIVHRYNDAAGRVKAAYTFDAGPNAVIFVERDDLQEVVSLLLHCFPPVARGADAIKTLLPLSHQPAIPSALAPGKKLPRTSGAVQMFYVSTVGGGSKVLPPSDSLIDLETGYPLTTEQEGKCWMEQSNINGRWLKLAAAAGAVALAAAWSARRR